MSNILITGGAGFIGCNAARRFLTEGHNIFLLDNLSRKGSLNNLKWLETWGDFTFTEGDVRDPVLLERVLYAGIDVVIHCAAQVAVTSSILEPFEDFDINACGTIRLLEAIRKVGSNPLVIFASTNKVYGSLEHVALEELSTRYVFRPPLTGISEQTCLDFRTPYACSKGVADQYVRDYSRTYGMRTVVLRQSAIYGEHQHGTESQGWVSWFVNSALAGRHITVYGDGKQVRDLLHVDDLTALYMLLATYPDKAAGKVYNVGGGPDSTMSVLELISLIETSTHNSVKFSFNKARPGDQLVYISDITAISSDFGWRPYINPVEGIGDLVRQTVTLEEDRELR